MRPEDVRHAEAILMVAEEPVAARLLAQVLETDVEDVERTLEGLAGAYDDQGRGFCLRQVAGGWRFYSHPDSSEYVERFVLANESPRLSKAAVETLAIVAYKQPISRAQIAEIRGVNSDAVVRNLNLRGLIEPVAHDDGPGHAALYGTSRTFLERLGLRDLTDLPPLADHTPRSGTAATYDAALSDGRVDRVDAPDIASRIRRKIAQAGGEAETEIDDGAVAVTDPAEIAEPGVSPEPEMAVDSYGSVTLVEPGDPDLSDDVQGPASGPPS